MKRYFFLAYTSCLMLVGFITSQAYAAAATTKIGTILDKLIGIGGKLIILVFVLAVASFGWSIVKFIAAAGNPEALKKARGMLLWSIIAIAVIASIGGIIALFQGELDIGGNSEIEPPQF